MSDPDLQPSPNLPVVDTFDFYGDTLIAVIIDGNEVVLPVRSVCGAIGLDAQSQRLREHDALPPLQEGLL